MDPQIDTAQRRAERCSARVYDKWRVDVSGHHCTKPAKVKIEGLWFCAVHDPAAVKRREQASYERYQARYSNPLRYTESELQAAKQQARREALEDIIADMRKALALYGNDQWRERKALQEWIDHFVELNNKVAIDRLREGVD